MESVFLLLAFWLATLTPGQTLDSDKDHCEIPDNLTLESSSTVTRGLLAPETWISTLGVWGQCQDEEQVNELLITPRDYPEDRLKDVFDWMKSSGAQAKCVDGYDIASLFKTLKNYPEERLDYVWEWMKTSGALEKCEDGCEISALLNSLKNYPEDTLKNVCGLMSTSRIKRKHTDAQEIASLFKTLKNYPEERLDYVWKWMKTSGTLEKCEDAREISSLFDTLKNYPKDRLQNVWKWMQTSGAWEKCEDGWQICKLLNSLDNYPQDRLKKVSDWIKSSGLWTRCQNGYNIASLFWRLKHYPQDRLAKVLNWMKKSGTWNKCQNGDQIIYLLTTLENYPEERLNDVFHWMKTSRAIEKCEDAEQINRLIYSLRKYPEQRLKDVFDWIKTSGAIEKCEDGDQIKALINALRNYPEDRLKDLFEWIKTSGAWEKFQSVDDILSALRLFCPFHSKYFQTCYIPSFFGDTRSLRQLDIMNHDFVVQILQTHKCFNFQPALCVLNQSQSLLGIEPFRDFYILCYGYYEYNPGMHRAIMNQIERPETRDGILRGMVNILGEDHLFSQHYLQLAIGYDNYADPNSFLAVYQEMRQKSQELVVHHPSSQLDGIELNLAEIQQPRPTSPIHMPITVWHELFDKLETLELDVKKRMEDAILGDVSWSTLMSLRQAPILLILWDPVVLKTNPNVSSYSHMLHVLLDNIRNTRNFDRFVQLLTNITSCPRGKLNGILHTYLLLDQTCLLDESMLETTGVKMKIKTFFQEGLRQFREATLNRVLMSIEGIQETSHDLYYTRGIIGREIGLIFRDEVPSIDINTHYISIAVRQQSKQQLLDKFYEHYTAEAVIDRTLTMLNDGSVSVIDNKTHAVLTHKIIYALLKEEAMDDSFTEFDPRLVALDTNNKPIGFTRMAAQKLLILLGVLKNTNPPS